MTNPQDTTTQANIFAIIGRLYTENVLLRQQLDSQEKQLALLQQQVAQGAQVPNNGKDGKKSKDVIQSG